MPWLPSEKPGIYSEAVRLNGKERFLKTLSGEIRNHIPVICPGGMMSMVCREVSEGKDISWPEAHTRPEVMVKAARDMQEATGFENYGVPFCVTVEAESLGSPVDYGDAVVEPQITGYILNSPKELTALIKNRNKNKTRIPVILEAISLLNEHNNDIPVIGNVTGPVSLATSLMDPNYLFRFMVKEKTFVKEMMHYVTELIADFSEAQVEAGADVISIGDPTASGEILGPELFAEFVLPSLMEIIRRIRKQKARAVLHICGHIDSILKLLPASGADAFSFDASMSIKKVRREIGDKVLMGNISTFLLAEGPVSTISRATGRAIDDGIDIVSPACGLGTGTPLANIRAMTEIVKKLRKSDDNTAAKY